MSDAPAIRRRNPVTGEPTDPPEWLAPIDVHPWDAYRIRLIAARPRKVTPRGKVLDHGANPAVEILRSNPGWRRFDNPLELRRLADALNYFADLLEEELEQHSCRVPDDQEVGR